MDCGPKGKPKKRFVGMIKEDGIEIGGKVYLPSIAALHSIQTISPSGKLPN